MVLIHEVIYENEWTVFSQNPFLLASKPLYRTTNRRQQVREKIPNVFKLPCDKKLKELSKGNLARLNLIVGLCQYADYLLLNEPFRGINVFTRESFIKALKTKFMEEGQTVIIATYEIDEIQTIANTVILLEEGRVFKAFSKTEAEKEGLTEIEKMRTLYQPNAKVNE